MCDLLGFDSGRAVVFADRLQMVEGRSALLFHFRQRRGYFSEVHSGRARNGANLRGRNVGVTIRRFSFQTGE